MSRILESLSEHSGAERQQQIDGEIHLDRPPAVLPSRSRVSWGTWMVWGLTLSMIVVAGPDILAKMSASSSPPVNMDVQEMQTVLSETVESEMAKGAAPSDPQQTTSVTPEAAKVPEPTSTPPSLEEQPLALAQAVSVVPEGGKGADLSTPPSQEEPAPTATLQPKTVGTTALITAVSTPPGAGLLVDGKFLGVTPLQFEWAPGEYELVLKKNGYHDIKTQFTLDAGDSVDFDLTLYALGSDGHHVAQADIAKGGVKAAGSNPTMKPTKSTEAKETVVAKSAAETAVQTQKSPSVAGAVSELPAHSVYTVQVGAYQMESSVQHDVEMLRGRGYAPYVLQKRNSDGRTWNTIHIGGRYTVKEEAQAEADKFAKKESMPADVRVVARSEFSSTGVAAASVPENVMTPVEKKIQKADASVQTNQSTSTPHYSIQVGAYLNLDGAEEIAKKLREKGYDAFVRAVQGRKDPSKTWQSVRIGRFDEYRQANAVAQIYRDKEHALAYVAVWDSFEPGQIVGGVDAQQAAAIKANMVATLEPTETVVKNSNEIPVEQKTGKSELSLARLLPNSDVSKGSAQAAPSTVESEKMGQPLVEQPKESIKQTTAPVVAQAEAVVTPKKAAPEKSVASAMDAQSVATGSDKVQMKSANEQKAPLASEKSVVTASADAQKPSSLAAKSAAPESAKTVAVEQMEKMKPVEKEGMPAVVSVPVVTKATAVNRPVVASLDKKLESGDIKKVIAQNTPSSAVDMNAIHMKLREPEPKEMAENLYREAVIAQEGGHLEKAEELLKQILERYPQHQGAMRQLARLMVASNRTSPALELLEKQIKGQDPQTLAKNDPSLGAFMAALYQREEKHWQAIELYEALLNIYPDRGIWRMGMAISLEQVSETEAARSAYELALSSGQLNYKLRSFVQKRIERL
ncbi:MAG: SPOR domain-containing protein [Magnetococcus sp. DMHC-6]